ncbi:hypothetical protein [Ferrimicrobium sp.]|uniref:tetratricopeptide repeat protein n=2 Tax=Ferrimicrobium sp. TaxID=2926050 RepID=UPI002639A8E0|nr:hypothetical protein [Ferrimicrobium sp.]
MSARSDDPQQFGESGSSDRPDRPRSQDGDRPRYSRPRDTDRDRGGDVRREAFVERTETEPLTDEIVQAEPSNLPSLRFHASRWLQREGGEAPSRTRIREDGEVASKIRPQRESMRGKSRSAMQQLLARATEAYERDRFEETLRITRRIDSMDPDEPEVLELMGLSLYRLARYDAALRVLRKVHKSTDNFDQVPVLMDCARALGRTSELDRWWLRLREASPAKEVIVEGRIVYAGALADQGKLSEAITLMEQGLAKERRATALTSIRQRYLLAQLFERAGDASGAREIYLQLFKEDKNLYDVAERLAVLS